MNEEVCGLAVVALGSAVVKGFEHVFEQRKRHGERGRMEPERGRARRAESARCERRGQPVGASPRPHAHADIMARRMNAGARPAGPLPAPPHLLGGCAGP